MSDITIEFITEDKTRRHAEIVAPIICADDEKRLVYGLAMEPDEVDTHGEFTTREDIETAAHGFMDSRMVGVQHREEAPAKIVESYIAQRDLTIGGQGVKEGSWIVVLRIEDDALWTRVKAGDFQGVSIGGWAVREAQE